MSQIFSNTQVDLAQIPRLEDLDFKPISKNYLKLLIIQRSIPIVVIIILLVGARVFVNDMEARTVITVALSALIILSFLGLIFNIFGFKERKYAIREHDMVYAKGLLVHKATTVPFKRIQHIELKQSFLAKKFDVATLNIYTAGESGGDLTINGLESETAERINEFLSTKLNESD